MSTTTQQWRCLPVQTLSVTTIVGILDAIYTAMTGVTYYDGAARTPGSGSAWTFQRYQNAGTTEAVYGTPPTDTLNQRVIFGGATGAKTPTMCGPDTWAANSLLGGINKNSGAFLTWDGASPFTSGTFSGFWKFANPGGITAAKVRIYESQECLAVFVESSTGTQFGGFLGAILDSESTDTTTDSESDGKLYGMITSGHTAISATFNTASANQGETNTWTAHINTNAQAHGSYFLPGTSTFLTMCRGENPTISNTTSMKTTSGRWVRMPQTMIRRTADYRIGRLREIFLVNDARIGMVHQESGADVYYYVGGSPSADQDCLGLLY